MPQLVFRRPTAMEPTADLRHPRYERHTLPLLLVPDWPENFGGCCAACRRNTTQHRAARRCPSHEQCCREGTFAAVASPSHTRPIPTHPHPTPPWPLPCRPYAGQLRELPVLSPAYWQLQLGRQGAARGADTAGPGAAAALAAAGRAAAAKAAHSNLCGVRLTVQDTPVLPAVPAARAPRPQRRWAAFSGRLADLHAPRAFLSCNRVGCGCSAQKMASFVPTRAPRRSPASLLAYPSLQLQQSPGAKPARRAGRHLWAAGSVWPPRTQPLLWRDAGLSGA